MSQKIAGPSVVFSGDISGVLSAQDQIVRHAGRSAEEIARLYKANSERIEASFVKATGGMSQHIDSMLSKIEAKMTKGNYTLNTEKSLKAINQLATAIDDVDAKIRVASMLEFGKNLRIPEVVAQVHELNSALDRTSSIGKTVGEVISSTMAKQAADLAAYNAWLQKSQGASQRIVGQQGSFTGQGPFGIPSGSYVNPWTTALGGYGQRPDVSFASFPPEYNDWRTATQGAYDRNMNPYGQPARAGLSPAAIADREEERRRVYGGAYNRNMNPYGQRAPVPLSPAAQALRDEAAREYRNRVDAMVNYQGPATAPGYNEWLRQQPEIDIDDNSQAAQDDYNRRRSEWLSRRPTTPTPGESLRQRAEAYSNADMARFDNEAAYNRYRQNRFGDDNTRLPGGRRRMNGSDSNTFRAAAQNVGFGVDDAIQSYQYGGMRASIRAASNNATAIAGLMITSPVIAAASIIAISAASAALPTILDRYWAKEGRTAAEEQAFMAAGMGREVSDGVSIGSSRLAGAVGGGNVGLRDARATLAAVQEENRLVLNQSKALSMDNARLQQQRFMERQRMIGDRTEWELGVRLTSPEEAAKAGKGAGFAVSSFFTDLYRGFGALDNQSRDIQINKGLREENLKKQEELRLKVQEAEKKAEALGYEADFNRRIATDKTAQDRTLGFDLTAGKFTSGRAYRQAIAEAYDQRQISVIGNKRLTPAQKEMALQTLRDEFLDRTSDIGGLDEEVLAANFNRSQMMQRFNFANSGNRSSVGRLTNAFRLESSQIRFDQRNDPATRNSMLDALSTNFNRERTRALQDELDQLSPEKNPVARLAKAFERSREDIDLSSGSFTVEEQRKRKLALLRGTEDDRYEAMKPSGRRQYISSAYMIGSQEDENLRSMMLTGYENPSKKAYDDSLTLKQIEKELVTLNQQLKISAEGL